MTACEKCWADAYARSLVDGRSQTEHYYELLKEREDHPCAPEEQAGDTIRGNTMEKTPEQKQFKLLGLLNTPLVKLSIEDVTFIHEMTGMPFPVRNGEVTMTDLGLKPIVIKKDQACKICKTRTDWHLFDRMCARCYGKGVKITLQQIKPNL